MERRGSKFFARLCALLTAVALLCAFGIIALAADGDTVNEPVCYTHGDVNGDGVIDNRDAIYTLYHFMYGEEQYPVDQDWDFNSDGEHSNKDAIYVLYASLYTDDPDYQLKGFVHSYYDPAWEWSEEDGEVTAQVAFKCGCGEDHLFATEEGGITVVGEITKEPTCAEAGTFVYTATIEFDGQEYTNTKTETIDALGHEMDGFQDCDNGVQCSRCDYALPALGHAWEKTGETEATCAKRATITYQCQNCFSTRTEETGEFADHNFVDDGEITDEADPCKVTKQLKCTACPLTAVDSVYYVHDYVAEIVAPTCVQPGSKQYVCSKCGDREKDAEGNDKIEVLTDANAHAWTATDEEGVFRCDHCDSIKRTVNAVNQAVSKTNLEAADEMKLSDNGASMAVDSDTLSGLGLEDENSTLKVTVDSVPVENLQLPEEQKNMILSGTVYDFKMEVNETPVDDFGTTEITISLPYELSEGEDPESIQVWYIDDATGTVESFEGTYNNGFVTFTTNHFSYYTVTRMTPAERCARYGHIEVATHKDATCTENGFDLVQCQRCGAKSVDQVLPKIGHSYVEATKAATCTEEGEVTKTCENCGRYLIEKIPALGHKMEKNETLSTVATCTSAGKEVHNCVREGCSEKIEKILPQLTHSYKLYDEKDPDCTNKGHKKNKCEYCGHVVTEIEKAPTGHDYLPENAIWQWSEDHKSAKVILVCAHDKNHTKELTAVVSAETKTETTCLGSGAVTYTAVAKFNKAEFTNSVTVAQAAAGHKPGSSWSKDETAHWHVCSACGETVDVAFHNWDEGKVTTAPTCAEAGETLYTCTTCGQQKTVTVKATGAHDYHFGICKNCGFGQSTCSHELTRQTPADMSEYGLCEGALFYWMTCDCGQNKTLVGEELGCNFGEPAYRMETDKYGWEYEVEIVTCPDCGLVGETYNYPGIDEENCARIWIDSVRILKDGEVLLEQVNIGEDVLQQHPIVIVVDETDLSQYGFCGAIVKEMTCPCGQNGGFGFDTEGGCQFQYNAGVETCVNCGGEVRMEMKITKGETECITIRENTREFYIGGELVHTYTWTSTDIYHNEELVSYRLKGDSCEDGLEMVHRCVICGETSTRTVYYHETCVSRSIDLSGYDICSDTLIQRVCPCGKQKESTLTSSNGNFCQFGYSDNDGDGLYESGECWQCHATSTITATCNDKDEDCYGFVYYTETYRDKQGNLIATAYRAHYDTLHNLETTATLENPDDCTKGVLIVESCKDCDYQSEWTVNHHYHQEKAVFDLSAFNMCATRGVLMSCLCGEEEYFYYSGGGCEWVELDNGEWGSKCIHCGIESKETSRLVKAVDPCHTVRNVTLSFSRDGEVLGKFSFDTQRPNHFFKYELTILDPAAGCTGGVRADGVCVLCGYEQHVETPDGMEDHPCFPLDQEIICREGLCGILAKTTNGCACGEEQWTNVEWHGDQCYFEHIGHDEQTDQEISECKTCGTICKEQHSFRPDSATTCIGVHVNDYEFYKDGQLLCRYEQTYEGREHVHVAEPTMLGETCMDGVQLSWNCIWCDEGYTEDFIRYEGHSTFPTEAELIYAGDETCGRIFLQLNRCACGENSHVNLQDYTCDWEFLSHDDQTNIRTEKCRTCGVIKTTKQYEETQPGTCDAQNVLEYSYTLDGNVLCQGKKGLDFKRHVCRYVFELLGQTCNDGYYMTQECVYCDYTQKDETVYYGCNMHTVDEVTVCDNEAICHPIRVLHQSCACGLRKMVAMADGNCWFEHVGTDEATGYEIRRCNNCGLEKVGKSRTERTPGSCEATEILDYTYSLNGEELGSIVRSYAVTMHDIRYSFTLEGESCDDGYYVTEQCRNCQYFYSNPNREGGHREFPLLSYDLTDFGICGGDVWINRCPCGDNIYYSGYVSCNWQWTGNTDPDTGLEERYCATCDSYSYYGEVGVKDPNTCKFVGNYVFKLVKNGELLLNVSEPIETYKHQHLVAGVNFDTEDRNCESGATVRMVCKCGDAYEDHITGHNHYQVGYIDLKAAGFCGGEISTGGCVCGKDDPWLNYDVRCTNMTSTQSNFKDADGVTHHQEIRECKTCGLKIVYQWYETPDAGCRYIHHETYEIYKNEELIDTLTVHRRIARHVMGNDAVYTLAEGSVTCEDGLNVAWNCTECGEYLTGTTNGHHLNKTETVIDLTPYGSVCGASLQLYQCPCSAKIQEYRYGDGHKCDMSEYGITSWITGAAVGDQPGIHEHIYLYNNAWEVGCGVTDPIPCGLRLRRAEYWLEEKCVAEKYITWMGYDAQNDEWKDIVTYSTGELVPWHDYQVTSSDNRVNGTGTTTYNMDCACGSYRHESETWENDMLTKRENDYYNALSIGQVKRFQILDEGFVFVQSKVHADESFMLPIDSVHTTTEMDGSQYTDRYNHSYDFSGSCKEVFTHIDRNGNQYVSDGHAHVIRDVWEMHIQPTCTKYGEMVRPCRICGEVTDQERSTTSPTMHSFQWDDEKGKYVCADCQLESVRDFSGSIAMEDLTVASDADYTIGYWNRDEIEVMPRVSVILYDVSADENDELVLTGIEFTELTLDQLGSKGLSFNKAATQTAADQAIADAGYSGSYGIRISFIPLETQDELDYAITFDTQTTAE